MELNGCLQVMLGGAVGAALLELVKIAAWQDAKKVSERYRRPGYWIGTLALLIVAGTVAALHSCERVPALTAAQLGAAAPLMVSNWASARSAAAIQKKGFGPTLQRRKESGLSFWELLSW
jgi:hypothetical protein